ncbi:hypothetical protein AB1Y20_019468 [Prymnesium parvum]|uniref:Transmembrane protein n=1 Tax=Prymnesium parvum TaxID=97485 RepID=A0AB34JU73_PRYPA
MKSSLLDDKQPRSVLEDRAGLSSCTAIAPIGGFSRPHEPPWHHGVKRRTGSLQPKPLGAHPPAAAARSSRACLVFGIIALFAFAGGVTAAVIVLYPQLFPSQSVRPPPASPRALSPPLPSPPVDQPPARPPAQPLAFESTMTIELDDPSDLDAITSSNASVEYVSQQVAASIDADAASVQLVETSALNISVESGAVSDSVLHAAVQQVVCQDASECTVSLPALNGTGGPQRRLDQDDSSPLARRQLGLASVVQFLVAVALSANQRLGDAAQVPTASQIATAAQVGISSISGVQRRLKLVSVIIKLDTIISNHQAGSLNGQAENATSSQLQAVVQRLSSTLAVNASTMNTHVNLRPQPLFTRTLISSTTRTK